MRTRDPAIFEKQISKDAGYDGVILAGPTGCGKSALALELAAHLAPSQPAEIINADSMQIYQDLSIISARPSVHDCAPIPHHLYGMVDGHHTGSAGWWLGQAESQIESCRQRGVLPIIVGGTGLYLNALTKGMSAIPPIDPATRQHARDLSNQLGADFYDYVARRDPFVKDRLKPNDHQRLGRALEVYLQTGQSIGWWHTQTPPARHSFLYCILSPDRAALYEKINARFDVMMQTGALEEVKRLQTLDLPDDSLILKAIGVQELRGFLKGDHDLPTAIELAKRNSRRYAKRQMTWFRHQVDRKLVLEPSNPSILTFMILKELGAYGLG
ncbi:tRNA (adenosine(37)-N6)-dimethylallyltransferase MiaA [Candidatus Finniella inopinata]|uniref:tRNA dimethylallyltransferase n=1 Tax=Candidatus Finniella inopinata TaxID=1696036 RepID=A0A4Q7DJ59_9PROT|nr:tRNA (adenosine(37)-N6)-dimethylallyltransferase MiaA [Candidatus Finniella inopinata]RZI46175.1 tRNA (adenosine(37)-N6)-dimethylallyltransferase MiaA [Candidatus Finniella inopinata]